MDESSSRSEGAVNRRKRYKIIASVLICVGILLFVPNVIFKIASPFFLLTIPLGIIAFAFSVLGRSALLAIGSALLTVSFFILMFVGYLFEAMNPPNLNIGQEISSINAPEYTQAIRYEKDILNMIYYEDGVPLYIYFGQENGSGYKKFEKALNKVVAENNEFVYYYDTLKMPKDEVEQVLSILEIESTPCLVRIEKGRVSKSDTVADTEKIAELFTE